MVPTRVLAAISALALLSAGAFAHAQPTQKTPAQLNIVPSVAAGDLLLDWPVASAGPLSSLPFGTLENQVLSDLVTFPRTFASPLTAGPTGSGQIVLAGNLSGATASSLQTSFGLENSGKTLLGWNLSNYGGEADIVLNPQAGTGGLSAYAFSNAGALKLLWTFDLLGDLDLNGTVTATGFVGPLTGTASNASELGGETASSTNTPSTIMARDTSGNVSANAFVGVLAANPSTLAAGVLFQGFNTALSGETRVIALGAAPDGGGYINAQRGPLELAANGTVLVDISTDGVCFVGVTACIQYSVSASKFYFYNASGQQIASIDASGNMILRGALTQSGTP
jgi:hypothetical protein